MRERGRCRADRGQWCRASCPTVPKTSPALLSGKMPDTTDCQTFGARVAATQLTLSRQEIAWLRDETATQQEMPVR